MMPVTIENPQSLPILSHELRVFRAMFADYKRLVIKSELKGGFSGSKVYLVRSIRENAPELPSVVKIDLYERIEQEWVAFQSCIRYRLPNTAEIRGGPVTPPGSQHSGLWYPLAGAGIDEINSLHDYLAQVSVDQIGPFLEKRLFNRFGVLWQQLDIYAEYHFRSAYDDFLPLNLKIETAAPTKPPGWLHPETIDEQAWAVGDFVQVSGFKVSKLLRDKGGLSLDVPETHRGFRFHMYGVEDVDTYEIGQVIQRPFTGQITETRQGRLIEQAQKAVGAEMDLDAAELSLLDGRTLPNPLVNWQMALRRSMDVRVACIHGDLNMENVLVDRDTETVHLIDFAKSGQDHVLRDLLHLEMTVVNKILAETMGAGETAVSTILDLYRRLHCHIVQGNEVGPPQGQERVFTIIHSIREAARSLLYQPNNWLEYYNGLFIYLLGSLRFGDLDEMDVAPRPKALAFWGAAAVLDLMENEPDCTRFGKRKAVGPTGQVRSDWDIDNILAYWRADPLSQRLILFNILKSQFSLNELRELSYSLGLDLDELPPGGKSIKAQELVGFFERRGRLRRLLEGVSRERGGISWG